MLEFSGSFRRVSIANWLIILSVPGAQVAADAQVHGGTVIGRDAIVAAGSAVSRDVADGELRMVRAEQLVKPGWADRFHDAMRKKKAEKK